MITPLFSTARSRVLKNLEAPKAGAWLHVSEPTAQELDTLAESYNLDRAILADATDIYEAPRVEADEGVVYIFTRYCHPEGKEIATEPLLIIYAPEQLITIAATDTPVLERLLSGKLEVVTTQKTKTILQILQEVNNSYRSQLTKISRQILSIRAQLRKTDIDNNVFVQFIDLEEDLNEFRSALEPQATIFKALLPGKYLRLYEEDLDLTEDLTLSNAELIELTKSRLMTISNTREAYATIAANTLNKTFKRLTSISIFMTIPAITSALYGMNLHLPLAHNPNAFWYILAFVMAVTAITVWYFRRKKWL